MDTIAASGGYITAIAADHIVARGNTITGSIGVIFQWAQLQKLLDTLGVQMQEIKSGDLKAEPNALQAAIREGARSLQWDDPGFVPLVHRPRHRAPPAAAGPGSRSLGRTRLYRPSGAARRSSSMPWAARTRRSTGCARKRRSPTPSRSSIGSPMTRAPPSVSDS